MNTLLTKTNVNEYTDTKPNIENISDTLLHLKDNPNNYKEEQKKLDKMLTQFTANGRAN